VSGVEAVHQIPRRCRQVGGDAPAPRSRQLDAAGVGGRRGAVRRCRRTADRRPSRRAAGSDGVLSVPRCHGGEEVPAGCDRAAITVRHADVAVAVPVHAGPAPGIRRPRVGPVTVVIAVGVVGHVPARGAARIFRHIGITESVTVAVREVLRGHAVVHHAVAVVVVAIAHFRFARVQTGIPVVAVGANIVPVGIVVAVVCQARAVVVFPVAPFDVSGVDVVARIVAVRGVCRVARRFRAVDDADGRVAVPIVVRIAVPIERIHGAVVHAAAAVVVHQVAHLELPGVDARVAVVAVGIIFHVPGGHRAVTRFHAQGDVTVPVAVRIEEVHREHDALVHQPVAVVVGTVTDLHLAGVDSSVGVVAIGTVAHVARRLRAGRSGHRGISVRVAVAILVPGEAVRSVDVGGAFAVVVEPVAHFRAAGEHQCVGVVAVFARRNAVAVRICGTERAVAVEVLGVRAVFHGVRVHGAVRVIAVGAFAHVPSRSRAIVHRHRRVTVAVAVHVREVRELIHRVAVDHGVAVVVHAVTDFRSRRIDRRVLVVTIVAGREAVAVYVDGSCGVRIPGLDGVRVAIRIRIGIRVRIRIRIGVCVVGVDHAGFPGRVTGITTVEVDRDGTEPSTGRLRTITVRNGTGVEHESDERRGNEGTKGHCGS